MKKKKTITMTTLMLAFSLVLLGMVLCTALALSGKSVMGLLMLVFSAVAALFVLTDVEEV